MLKFPSRRILFFAGTILLVLLVVSVALMLKSEAGNVELRILEVIPEQNDQLRVIVLLTNGSSKTIATARTSGQFTQTYTTKDTAGLHWTMVVTLSQLVKSGRIDHSHSFTNSFLLPYSPISDNSRLRLATQITNNYFDPTTKLVVKINDQFPNLLPKKVIEKWGNYQSRRIYSDWITNTGIVSAVSDR